MNHFFTDESDAMTKNFPFPIGIIHIIGIGGIGMSGYAEVMHHLGYQVQGSDQAESANTKRLAEQGIRIMIGHKPENLGDAAVVVISTAIKKDNPEVIAAKADKIPVISRMDLLSELMRGKWCVNISGTHGKTTTTSMIGHVLEQAGLDPTVINGGIINAYGTNTRLGQSRWMVVESDESDGTFAHLPSVASIITNIDPEHLDHHGDFAQLKKAFVEYAHNLPFYGIVIACIDHPVVKELMPQFGRRTITYGFSDEADVQAVNIRATPNGQVYDVKINDPELAVDTGDITDVRLPMYGRHNVQNSLSGFALAAALSIPAEKTIKAFGSFAGVKRRFTTTGIVNDITVIDDYAHHPVEIAAVLKAGHDAVSGRGKGKIIAVMQPHRFTRLQNLFGDFANCFADADHIIISDVYTAGETPIAGIDRDHLVAAIKKTGKQNVTALASPQELPQLIKDIAAPGDFVICLGAGSITHWAYELPDALEQLFGLAPQKVNGGA